MTAKDKTLVLAMAQRPDAAFVAFVAQAVAGLAPQAVTHAGSYVRFEGVDLREETLADIRAKARESRCDVFVVDGNLSFDSIKALFFDMDSTLVNSETLDEMAAIHGLGEQCAKITADTMAGVIRDYPASLSARVALLKGFPASSIETVWKAMRPNPGVEEWIAFCNARGKKTYVVSSGFTILARRLAEKLAMTGYHTNEIGIEGDTFTGRYTGEVSGMNGAPIMDGNGKAAFVRRQCAELGISPSEALCAGDGSNDVAMVSLAGVGVGFRPKQVLRPHCAAALDFSGMDALKSLFCDAEERKPGLHPWLAA